jgi:hypothetical protein
LNKQQLPIAVAVYFFSRLHNNNNIEGCVNIISFLINVINKTFFATAPFICIMTAIEKPEDDNNSQLALAMADLIVQLHLS